jgi:hypothetical protein
MQRIHGEMLDVEDATGRLRSGLQPTTKNDIRTSSGRRTLEPTNTLSLSHPSEAGGQNHEIRYESKRTGASASDVKTAVKTAGNSRKKVEGALKK